jgi:RNA polymerase sigma-70 factor, ECF subfamily
LPRYSELSPAKLVQTCAGSKDPDAWAEFIRRFQPVIAATVFRIAHFCDPSPTRELLDDLVQDTYLKLCENDSRMLRSFKSRGKDSIYGYLKVVAKNIVLDHFKVVFAYKRDERETETPGDMVLIDPKTKGSNHEDVIYRNLKLEEIDKILLEVTKGKDQQRNCQIFRLRYRMGFTASEIAALPAIGLSTEGVESVLLRILGMIRSHMKKKGCA